MINRYSCKKSVYKYGIMLKFTLVLCFKQVLYPLMSTNMFGSDDTSDNIDDTEKWQYLSKCSYIKLNMCLFCLRTIFIQFLNRLGNMKNNFVLHFFNSLRLISKDKLLGDISQTQVISSALWNSYKPTTHRPLEVMTQMTPPPRASEV